MPPVHDIIAILGRFFTANEYAHFQYLQSITGLLISGSVALEFFTGDSFDGDLDLYCPLSSSLRIGLWLTRIGYEFRATTTGPKQAPLFITDWGVAIEEWSAASSADSSSFYAYTSGIIRVWNFCRNNESIQLVAVRSTPLSVILCFHSSLVMNAISDSFAFCFYPKATITSRVSVFFTDPLSSDIVNVVSKYSARGYSFCPPPLLSTILLHSEWSALHARSLRDNYTLAIPLKCLHSKPASPLHWLGSMSWVNDFRKPTYCSALFDVILPDGDSEGFVMAPLESMRAHDVLRTIPFSHGLPSSPTSRVVHRRAAEVIYALDFPYVTTFLLAPHFKSFRRMPAHTFYLLEDIVAAFKEGHAFSSLDVLEVDESTDACFSLVIHLFFVVPNMSSMAPPVLSTCKTILEALRARGIQVVIHTTIRS